MVIESAEAEIEADNEYPEPDQPVTLDNLVGKIDAIMAENIKGSDAPRL